MEQTKKKKRGFSNQKQKQNEEQKNCNRKIIYKKQICNGNGNMIFFETVDRSIKSTCLGQMYSSKCNKYVYHCV